MNTHSSRRTFLRGAFREAPVLRPFGAATEGRFRDLCNGCGDCVPACPEGVLAAGSGGLPVFETSAGACTFCGACIAACDTGALAEGRAWPWTARAETSCLSMSGTQCRACQDHCELGAIRFRLQTGGRAEPRFDADLCTGCGGCVAPCPVGAIRLAPAKPTPQSNPEARTC